MIKLNKKRHRSNLRDMRACVDNKEPDSYKYPLGKAKKEMLIEGKLSVLVLTLS